MILTQAQAEAVYSAMCALNNVGLLSCDMRLDKAIVTSDFNGAVRVVGSVLEDDELYPTQSAFATAYGLQQG